MEQTSGKVAPALAGLLLATLFAGCSQLNDDDLLDPAASGLEGSWGYVVDNANEATFRGCTGDAAILEGRSFVQAMGVAPICTVAGSFDVLQSGDVFSVVPHGVVCSDGSSATIGGDGSWAGSSVSGQWDSVSTGGVTAIQAYTGSITGPDTIQLVEVGRSFDGGFRGSCDLSPPLVATVEVR